VILGVTGPNEYENNVSNNWYTNYIAKWCMEYTLEQLQKVKDGYPEDYNRIIGKTKLSKEETDQWKKVADKLYFP
jgi:maltose phosphorylase